MVQLDILTGQKAGTLWVARRFPFQVGRSAPAHLTLEDDGVWDLHFQIDLQPDSGAILTSSPEAFTAVNGHPVQTSGLRNGDLVEAGSVKMRFSLSPTRQYSLRFREALTWIALATLCLGQVALIYWLAE